MRFRDILMLSARQGGGAGIPAAPTAPGYLSNVVAPYAAWGAQRLISGYAGALFRLRRVSDSVEQDFSCATGGDYPDLAAITTFMGASTLCVSKIYDQTGNARDLVQATTTKQPKFDPAYLYSNTSPFILDGVASSVVRTMVATGLTLDVIAYSMFSANLRIGSNTSSCGIAANSATPAAIAVEYYNSFVSGWVTSTQVTSAMNIPVSPLIAGMTSSATAQVIYANGVTYSASNAKTTTAIDRVSIGEFLGFTSLHGVYDWIGGAIYASTLSGGNAATISASLATATATPTAFDYNMLAQGDSIVAGTGQTNNQNVTRWLYRSLSTAGNVFNHGSPGQTLAQMYTNRTTIYPKYYTAARPSVVFVNGGTNDLITSGTAGATLYSGTTAPLITYLQGLGYKVGIQTILPATGYTAPKEAERQAYNALVIANSAGADYVLDGASHAVMGAVGANLDTTLYADGIHPTSLGYRWLAGAPSGTYSSNYTYYYALQQVLRTTALGGGYVP